MALDVSEFQDFPGPMKTELARSLEAIPTETVDRLTDIYGSAAVARTLAYSEFARRVFASATPESALGVVSDSELDSLSIELDASVDVDKVMQALRQFRRLWMARLLLAEIAGVSTPADTIVSLSRLADACISIACRVAQQSLEPRFGVLRSATGEPIPLVVIGMGKLGGDELNFSSDVDLIFLYPEQGTSDGRREADAQEYCLRWSQAVVRILDEVTADGFVFRVDTRLRPFGDSGPPVCSYAALESYLLNHARSWERYAYVKARVCNLPPDDDEVRTLEDQLLRPFVYRGYLDYGLLESLRDVHQRIHEEQKGLDDNLKLGRGGIREIEFIVQSVQLLRGGRQPELRTQSLLQALDEMAGSTEMPERTAGELREAYLFLRRLENTVQGRADQQTHSLPSQAEDLDGLAHATGFDGGAALLRTLDAHRALVRSEFERVARTEAADSDDDGYRALWVSNASTDAWESALPASDSASAIAEHMASFAELVARQKLEDSAAARLADFIPCLLELALDSDRPAIVVERCVQILRQVLRRSAYIALLNENREVAERLCFFVERSQYVAEQLSQSPVLLDVFFDPGQWSTAATHATLADELDHALSSLPEDDSEARTEALAQFQRLCQFRIALAEISGAVPLMKTSDALSWLAEVVLEAGLRIALGDTLRRHGRPCFVDEAGQHHHAGFAVIAYGKLGGLELSYGSDLDIVFVHDSTGSRQVTDGERSIDNSMFFARVARRMMHVLTTHTRSGVLYEIDTRLRPSGRSGLLVSSLSAFERYQREEAWTWEHQALLRARSVAGSESLSRAFEALRVRVLTEQVRRDTLLEEVVKMRRRMRGELDKSTATAFDLKNGVGGIGDIEFIVQYLALQHADKHPSVIEFSDNIRQLDALADEGVVDASMASGLQDIYRLYRSAMHRQVLDGRDRMLPEGQFADERAYVTATWESVFSDD